MSYILTIKQHMGIVLVYQALPVVVDMVCVLIV